MKKYIIASSLIVASLAFGGVSHACDMHGAGYGHPSNYQALSNAKWKPYNPRVSTIDPAYGDPAFGDLAFEDGAYENFSAVPPDRAPVKKAKPSFSNAAQLASLKAKIKLAEESSGKKPAAKGQSTALNTDR
jgi:hypothetical protein